MHAEPCTYIHVYIDMKNSAHSYYNEEGSTEFPSVYVYVYVCVCMCVCVCVYVCAVGQ